MKTMLRCLSAHLFFTRLFFICVAVSALLMLAANSCDRSKPAQKQESQTTDSSTSSSASRSMPHAALPVPLPVYVPEVIRSIPHDTSAFTQGLCFHNGELYESTGQYSSSTLRHVDWKTGKVLKSISVPSEYFAEGLVVLGEKAYQLTWRENMGFIYDVKTLKRTGSFSYYGEGWGLTTDGEMLIMSDGSNVLRFLDSKDLSVKRTLFVTAQTNQYDGSLGASVPLNRLNELEYVGDEIYANVWYSDSIARINPTSGKVTGWIDMSAVGDNADRRTSENVLNGIAHDSKRDVLLVTGKLWAKMYEIKLKLKE